MSGRLSEEVGGPTVEEPYDSFVREVARVTDGASPAAIVPLHTGARLLDGRFEVERTLGSGGMGMVYAARDHQRGCAVAVKTLRAVTLDSLSRLRNEFLVLHDLWHPNLVSLGEMFDDEGRWFFSMELVDGVDFLRHVRPDGRLDLDRLRSALAQLAAGLGFLHAAGVVHCDVKPSNVLCTGDRIVLLDFGLASASGGGSARAGTLPYMAPEQHAGAELDDATDWYAVGVMLWAALAGRLPFSGNERELAARKQGGAPAVDGPPDLVTLAEALLRPDPAQRPDDDEILQRLGALAQVRTPATPFVGRGRELAALRGAWAEARGTTATVLMRGPSGVGKSALLAQFADELRSGGAIVLIGRCHERVAMPYKAMHGIAAGLAARLRSDGVARAIAVASRDVGLLPDVFPALSEIEELARAADTAETIRDPLQRRTRVFDAFAGLIGRLARHAPLGLMIDDLQWADRDGLALLQHVTATVRAGLLVVAAVRDGTLDPASERLAAGTCIDVGGLAREDAEDLARQLAGDAAAEAIAREATGHPLHIAELARHGQLVGAAPRLDDAIARRVLDLPADHARVLALIAIAGVLPQAIIGDAAGLDGAAWWSALAELRTARLVCTHGPRGSDVVEPYHDRVRETVVARLAREVAVAGHQRLADALEARGLGAERPDLLAHHLEGSGRPVEAARWTERAGDQAAHSLAFDRAADLYQRTLELASHEPAHELSLHVRLGDALVNAGRGAPAAKAYLAGTALVTGDEARELRRRAAEQLLRSGHVDDGLRLLDEALREVGLPTASRRRWPLASLLIQRALLRVRRWRGPGRRASTDGDRRRLACCWSAAIGLAATSPWRTVEYQARYLRLALASRDPRNIALGLCNEASTSAQVGPPADGARALLAEARSWAAQVDGWFAEPYFALTEGAVAYLCGQWRDALERFDAAVRMFRDEHVGVAWEIGTARHLALSSVWHMGRISELRPRLARAVDEDDRSGDHRRTTLQPMVDLMDDREADAREALARAEQRLPREITNQQWQHMESSALVELYAGAPVKAVELVERQLPAFRRGFLMRVYLVHAFTAFVRATACLGALAQGAREPARLRASIHHARRGLDARAGTRPMARLFDAQLAVLHGDLDAAVASYRLAATGFDGIDMMLTAEAARWRLGELLGGDEGRALVHQATAALSAEGIVRPDRVVAMLAAVPASARRSIL